MFNLFDVGRGPQIYQNWTINGGENLEGCCKKWRENSFVNDNARETIAENWSDRIDESESIKKKEMARKYV